MQQHSVMPCANLIVTFCTAKLCYTFSWWIIAALCAAALCCAFSKYNLQRFSQQHSDMPYANLIVALCVAIPYSVILLADGLFHNICLLGVLNYSRLILVSELKKSCQTYYDYTLFWCSPQNYPDKIYQIERSDKKII